MLVEMQENGPLAPWHSVLGKQFDNNRYWCVLISKLIELYT